MLDGIKSIDRDALKVGDLEKRKPEGGLLSNSENLPHATEFLLYIRLDACTPSCKDFISKKKY